jgi:hypothetical protein
MVVLLCWLKTSVSERGDIMTEEQTPGTEEQVDSSEILDELHSLGQQLATAVKSLWESDESRKLRRDIEKGFVELGHQVETAVESARESDPAKQFSEQVKDTMEKARESEIPTKMEDYLVTGLRELNTQVSKMVSSLASSGTAAAEPAAEPEAEPEADSEA